MRYDRIYKAKFIERPNRFIAYAELNGKKETVHVKNTGRCAELLRPGADIYIQESDNPSRKTRWDLIAVKKGSRMINMDSQIPNKVVKEWIEQGNLFGNVTLIRPETVYKNSRFDLYVEAEDQNGGIRKIFIEIKGVTLEENGVCRFPDAPSERAVKHLEELSDAKKNGYEAYVFFVIQMKGVRYFTPNTETHPQFAEALQKTAKEGVKVLAYDCDVTSDAIELSDAVDVVLGNPILKESVRPLVEWFRENKRDLPWRKRINAYRVWISEIMLQQTRVEAVKPYYERFLSELPDVSALAPNRPEAAPQAAKAAKRNAPAKYPPSMARDLETPRWSSIRPMTGEKRLPIRWAAMPKSARVSAPMAKSSTMSQGANTIRIRF